MPVAGRAPLHAACVTAGSMWTPSRGLGKARVPTGSQPLPGPPDQKPRLEGRLRKVPRGRRGLVFTLQCLEPGPGPGKGGQRSPSVHQRTNDRKIKLLGTKGRNMLVRSLGFFVIFFFIKVNQLIYNVTPISAVQNSD